MISCVQDIYYNVSNMKRAISFYTEALQMKFKQVKTSPHLFCFFKFPRFLSEKIWWRDLCKLVLCSANTYKKEDKTFLTINIGFDHGVNHGADCVRSLSQLVSILGRNNL